MSKIKVDFTKNVGKIKPMHGVGQGPLMGTNFSMFSYLKDAGIPFSRLHDVGGVYGQNRFVDIPNIFRDFDADPADPAAYDFTFTDMLIKALVDNGVEPFFRLGVTIENDGYLKAYRIYPPKDYLKWAKICEGVIRHYTEGWADGFNYDIRYWEIWNEPDNSETIENNSMWKGTMEEFFEFYDVAAKHLKSKFPQLKIGGYGSCGFYAIYGKSIFAANSTPRLDYFITFFDGFLAYVKEHNTPLDFFSWHSYDSIENNIKYAAYARNKLDEAGFTATETTCNEWHRLPDDRGTMLHASLTAGMLLALQKTALDNAMFYDARISESIYGGLFNPMTRKPLKAYYGFVAFNELYKAGNEVYSEADTEGLYLNAAVGENGKFIMLSNTTENEISLDMELIGAEKIKKFILTDENNEYVEVAFGGTLPAASFALIELE